VAFKRRKERSVFTPLDDSLLTEREIVRLGEEAFLTRPSNSIDNTKMLFSVLSPSERTSLYVAPRAEPVLVNWAGVGKTTRYRLRRTRKVTRGLTRSILFVVTLALVALIAAQLSGVVLLRNVATGSMRPGIKPGDIEVTVSPSLVHVHKGSIVIYRLKSPTGRTIGAVGHRIIGGSGNKGWIVKGDHNPYPDPKRYKTSQLLGVVVLVIPKLGKYFTLNVAVYGLLGLVAYWLLSDLFRRRSRRAR
jgi:signal peptidase I